MFKNYLKIAVRNLVNNKVYSIVNILGLVLGMTCGMIMILYIHYELSYDRFNIQADRIYRLVRETMTSGSSVREPLSSAPMAKAVFNDFSEVANTVRFGNLGRVTVQYEERKFYEEHLYYVDPSVFDIFTIPMISGDPKTSLAKPYSVVVTEEMAVKYFGNENPIGKVLKFNNQHDYLVTGIIKNVPENSHIHYDMLCSIETLAAQKQSNLDNWLSFDYLTYVLLKENADAIGLEKKFPVFVDKYFGNEFNAQGKTIRFYLHPLKKIHLYSHLEGYPPGRITQVYSFSTLATLVILIACINFMNLCTARSTKRAKEVGIRKVVGAERRDLIYQFLGEALFLSILSFLLAVLLTELLLPAFSTFIHQKISLSFIDMPWLIFSYIGLAVFIGVVAGSYPALYLSKFQPVVVLKDKLSAGAKRSRLRRIFVVLQFLLSTVLILDMFILSNQIHYLKNKELGFNKTDILVIPLYEEDVRRSVQVIEKELMKYQGVLHAAATSTLPGWSIPRKFKIPEGYTSANMQLMDDINIDEDFIPTLNITMAAGRNFSEAFPADAENSIIVNETAVKKFGWDNPIGKTVKYSVGTNTYTAGTVCGVVKDFHLASLYRLIEPLCMTNHPNNLNYLLIRINPENKQVIVDHVKEKWNELFPHYPFTYSFLDSSYDQYFGILDNILKISSCFTFMAVFIACLGIFALVSFIAEQRTKEIGVRKVLGATSVSIMVKLNKEIFGLVIIAVTLAILFQRMPLTDLHSFFPYLAQIGFSVYIETALLVIFIALLTISYETIKTALADPIDSLRNE